MKIPNTFALVMTLLAVSAFAQSSTSVSGNWKVSGDVAGHALDQLCTFTQDGKKLTGSCKSAESGNPSEVTGEVSDNKVSWQYNVDYSGEKLTISFAGTLDASGAQLKGDIDVQPYGVTGSFTAQKQEAKQAEPKKPQQL